MDGTLYVRIRGAFARNLSLFLWSAAANTPWWGQQIYTKTPLWVLQKTNKFASAGQAKLCFLLGAKARTRQLFQIASFSYSVS